MEAIKDFDRDLDRFGCSRGKTCAVVKGLIREGLIGSGVAGLGRGGGQQGLNSDFDRSGCSRGRVCVMLHRGLHRFGRSRAGT